jgi:Ice-binding-like
VPSGEFLSLSSSTFGDFIVLGGTSIQFFGSTTTILSGSLGTSPGTLISGPFSLVKGAAYRGTAAAIPFAAGLVSMYITASTAACPSKHILQSSDLSGATLTPGVYKSASGYFILSSSSLTLDGVDKMNAQWIFQTSTSLVTFTGTSLVLTNGAQAMNVFWAVGTSASIGHSSTFTGTILAQVSITYGSSSVILGRGFAMTTVIFAGGSSMALPTISDFSSGSIRNSSFESPSLAPTFSVSTLSPTAAVNMPIQSPTVKFVAAIKVEQIVMGVSNLDSQSTAFKNAMQLAIADSASVPVSEVEIETISASTTSSSLVSYLIVDPNGNATALSNNLQNAVTTGSMSTKLRSAGYFGAFASMPKVKNISPTSRPTVIPASPGPSLDLALIIGVTVGSTVFCCCLFCSCYFIFFVAAKRNTSARRVHKDKKALVKRRGSQSSEWYLANSV